MKIFDNNKNEKLKTLILDNPTTSYNTVAEYIATSTKWYKGYIAKRKALKEPWMSKNEIIWEIINELDDPDGDEFE